MLNVVWWILLLLKHSLLSDPITSDKTQEKKTEKLSFRLILLALVSRIEKNHHHWLDWMDIELFSIQTFSEDTMLFIKKNLLKGAMILWLLSGETTLKFTLCSFFMLVSKLNFDHFQVQGYFSHFLWTLLYELIQPYPTQ